MVPHADYVAQQRVTPAPVPHEVVTRAVFDGSSPARAWREYLGLTRAEVAQRLGIGRPDYAKRETRETREKLRKPLRRKIAAALGITLAQLDF
ncbi:helix-turn-helix transcriptional regulator [Burkholderia sp. AU18528]|uniref:helix-turn-helix transcriptional regulator n=1 Tax=Burkholderia TaxID=32008 RepID=UPI000A9B9D09